MTIEERADYAFSGVDKFDRGIQREERPDLFDGAHLYTGHNVKIEQNRLEVDSGYQQMGQDIPYGAPVKFVQFKRSSGVLVSLLVSTTTVYKWVPSTGKWHYLDGGVKSTLTAQMNPSTNEAEVVSAAGFLLGAKVGIELDDGTQHQATIDTIDAPLTTITIDGPGVESVASIGAVVRQATIWLGSNTEQVDYAFWPADERVYFTNNVTKPIYYDAVDDDIVTVENLPGSTFVAKTVDVWNNFVVFGSTVEDGTEFPQRIRWCDTGDPTNWTTGVANFEDLYETNGHIKDGLVLGNDLMIYKEDAYVKVEFVGSVTKLINVDTMVIGRGVLDLYCAVCVDDVHYLFDIAGIYRYEGGNFSELVSLPVNDIVFGVGGELNVGARSMCFAEYLEDIRQIFFFYPVDQDIAQKFLRLDLDENAWLTRSIPNWLRGVGQFYSQSVTRWADLVGGWDDQAWKWNAQAAQGRSRQLIIGSTLFKAYTYNFLVGDDAGNPITYTVETGDFNIQQGKLRLDQVRMYLRGTSVLFELSLDGGDTWETINTYSPGSSYQLIISSYQRVSDRMRFRLSGSGGAFGVRWFTPKIREETEY